MYLPPHCTASSPNVSCSRSEQQKTSGGMINEPNHSLSPQRWFINQGQPFFPLAGWKHVLSWVYTHPNGNVRQQMCGLKPQSHLPKLRRITSDSQNLESQTTSPAKMFLSVFSNVCTNILLKITRKFPWELSFLEDLHVNIWAREKRTAIGRALLGIGVHFN